MSRRAAISSCTFAEDLPQGPAAQDPLDPTHRHALEVVPGSLMERVYGEGEIRVNSMHHMAIDEVAPGFRSPPAARTASSKPSRAAGGLVRLRHAVPSRGESASALDMRIFEEFLCGITGETMAVPMAA